MTVAESLKSRARLILTGAVSFVIVVVGLRLAGGEPLAQPQADAGAVIGLALVMLFLVLNDLRATRS